MHTHLNCDIIVVDQRVRSAHQEALARAGEAELRDVVIENGQSVQVS